MFGSIPFFRVPAADKYIWLALVMTWLASMACAADPWSNVTTPRVNDPWSLVQAAQPAVVGEPPVKGTGRAQASLPEVSGGKANQGAAPNQPAPICCPNGKCVPPNIGPLGIDLSWRDPYAMFNTHGEWVAIGQPVLIAVACATCPSGRRYNGQSAQLYEWRGDGRFASHCIMDGSGVLGWWIYDGDKPRWVAR